MEVTPLGDSALVVRLGGDDRSEGEVSIDHVLAILARLERASIPGAVEWTSAYSTIALFFDPVLVARKCGSPNAIFERLATEIRRVLRDRTECEVTSGRLVEIPVCYNRAFAFDIDDVARHTNFSADEVVRQHSEANYRVRCIGFTPGFSYLAGLPSGLATPRRQVPRTDVPAGSIAIGGNQTGIYPSTSPGGWNVIGRTPLRLFDASRQPPALLVAGDRVSFRAISRDEFEQFPA
ncbi:MAG: 5-oxoprolinase subunit PxpB [Chthoniobacterales bacterium]